MYMLLSQKAHMILLRMKKIVIGLNKQMLKKTLWEAIKQQKKTVKDTDPLTMTMIMKLSAFQNVIKINKGWLNALIVINQILFQI